MSWTFARSTAVGVGVSLFLLALLVRAPAATAGVLDARWTAPTTNSDGSRLTDLASYRVYYGTQGAPCPGPSRAQVASPTSSPSANTTVRFRLTGLTTGTRYSVSVTAVDSAGNESPCSSVASAVARAEFTVSPTGTVSFGSVRAGSFADRTFTVYEHGRRDRLRVGIRHGAVPRRVGNTVQPQRGRRESGRHGAIQPDQRHDLQH